MQAGLVVPLEKGTGNLFIAAERPKGANSRIHHFLPQCITFNQSALRHEQLKEKHGEVRWVRECIVRCSDLEFSLWQIF